MSLSPVDPGFLEIPVMRYLFPECISLAPCNPLLGRCISVKAGAFREYLGRSVVKAISYRAVVVVADFAAVYLFTGRVEIALGFVVVSNIYTTGLYFLHERFWDRVEWGRVAG